LHGQFSQWGMSGSDFTAASTLADKNALVITHGAGDGVLPTKSVEYYFAPDPKSIGSPVDACKSSGGILASDTTALDLTTEPTTVCVGTQGTDSECTTTIQFGFAAGIGDSEFYEAGGDGTTATIQLCLRFTLQDIVVPRSEWCSSEEQVGMTLSGGYFGHWNGGGNKGHVCGDLCRSDPKCNTWMWRNSGNSCYLSEAEDLVAHGSGCCADHHAYTFNAGNCDPVPTGEVLDIRSGEFAFEWSIGLEGAIVSTEVFDAVDGGAESITASGVVPVEAFSCDSSGAEVDPSPSYTEGSTVYSCIRSTDARFHVVDIDSFTYESSSGTIVQNAVLSGGVSGGVEAARTVKDCTLVSGECQVATLLVDAFYSENDGTIKASGVALAEAPSSTRRRLYGTIMEVPGRSLQTSKESFDMKIQLASTSNSAAYYLSIAWTGALVIVAAMGLE